MDQQLYLHTANLLPSHLTYCLVGPDLHCQARAQLFSQKAKRLNNCFQHSNKKFPSNNFHLAVLCTRVSSGITPSDPADWPSVCSSSDKCNNCIFIPGVCQWSCVPLWTACCRHAPFWTLQHNKSMTGCVPSWPISEGVGLIKEI